MNKYIIDTDIGDDIDDALALDLALKLKIELIGITTVFRNASERALIAKKLLRLYGKDIPVYVGYGETLSREYFCPELLTHRLCQWTEDLSDPLYAPNSDASEDAINFIIESAKKYKNELYLLAIGPLTNVAQAILKDEQAMRSIGGIIMMGGDYVNDYDEWNIRCDVKAADIVFSSGINIVAFGHEVTFKQMLSYEQQDEVFALDASEYNKYLATLSKLWLKSKPEGFKIVLHDLMVARYASDPTYCQMNQAYVSVVTEGADYGKIKVYKDGEELSPKAKLINYSKQVDSTEFVQFFLDRVVLKPEEVK